MRFAADEEVTLFASSVREVVTRTLHQLQGEGLVVVARDRIELLDPLRLSYETRPDGLAAAPANDEDS